MMPKHHKEKTELPKKLILRNTDQPESLMDKTPITTTMAMDWTNNTRYAYWYCEHHDDAYRVLMKQNEELPEPKGNVCVSKEQTQCYWSFIGIRTFDDTGKCVHDNTQQFRFNERAGGYEREYLDQCETIDLEPTVKSVHKN